MKNLKVISAVSSAVALGIVASVAHAAVTVTAGTANYGIEYSTSQAAGSVTSLWKNNTAAAAGDSADWSSNVNYLTGDVVTVTLGGTAGARFSTSALESATLVCDTNDDGTASEAAITAATSANDNNTYVFTLTANCDAGDNVFLVGADLLNSTLGTAGTITLSVGATRSGSTIDSTATAGTVASVVREYDVTVATPFDGVIRHDRNNKIFTTGSTDALAFTIVNNELVGDTDSIGSATALTVTLAGNFSIVDDDGDGACVDGDLTAGDGRAVISAADGTVPAATINSTCSLITIPLTATQADMDAGDGGTLTVTLNSDFGGGGSASLGYLIPQTITGTATLAYVPDNAAATTRAPTVAPGSFTSDAGSTVFVPWMPAGPTTSQSLWITNNSSANGTVTVTGRNQNGVPCSAVQAGGAIAVGANRTVSLGNAIVNCIENAWGGFDVTQKFFLTLTSNLPDEQVEVFTQFNVGGTDRGFIMNSSNGRSPVANGMGTGNSTGTN